MLQPGDAAPDINLLDATGQEFSFDDVEGKWVILYFYPKDNTPGCTVEALEFTALSKSFQKAGAVVIGVSKDSCASHANFIAKKDLDLVLLSDPDHVVQEAYDVWQMKKFMGKEFLGTVRSTFIIDPKRVIRSAQYKVSAKGHAQDVLNELRELK